MSLADCTISLQFLADCTQETGTNMIGYGPAVVCTAMPDQKIMLPDGQWLKVSCESVIHPIQRNSGVWDTSSGK
jgi:hypothetical protein